MTKRLQHDDYKVAWICPMEVEQIAAEEMLDEEHDDLPQPEADHNVYKLGSINGHNIVIAGLHETGNCAAAVVVTQMQMTFRKLKFGLLVGIGGGVPVATNCGMIRLGHVVVSNPAGAHSGVVQYDHGKAISEGQFERTGSLAPPPAVLLNAARRMGVQRKRARGKQDPILENVSRIDPKHPPFRQFGFEYPGEENDFLFPSGHGHQQQGMSCEAGGCDLSTRVLRLEDTDRTFVTVHMGNIASGERVIKDATLRDALAKQYGLLCFETEAAGVATNFPCLTIRGISNYCDSHKNDQWRGYAAAVASGYARQLFFHMPVEEMQRVQLPAPFTLSFQLLGIHSVDTFIAREMELMRMHELLKGPRDRRIVTLHGLGGMGKTQTAIQYAKRHRDEYSAVIWLNAKDATSLQKTFHRAARRILGEHPSVAYLQTAISDQDLHRSVEAVHKWLNEKGNDRWLIVYDNYVTVKFDGDDSPNQMTMKDEKRAGPDANEWNSSSYDIRPYIPEAYHGAIIITTRSSTVNLGHLIRLPKLEDVNDSLAILASTSQRERLSQEPDAISLARKLDGLPLALATAGAYLRQVSVTCTEYLEEWDKSWLKLQENTSRPRTYEQEALYSTWNLSYQYIQRKNIDAAVLLRLWAYFDNEDLRYELLNACEQQSDAPLWLQRITTAKFDFHKTMRTLCEYGLAEANPPMNEPGPDSQGYSMHECVHAWIIHVLNLGLDPEMAFQATRCASWYALSDEEPVYWVLQRRLLRHADRCLRIALAKNEAEVDAETKEARPYHHLALFYKAQGRFRDAETLYRRAFQAGSRLFGPDSKFILDVQNNLAEMYTHQERFEDAKNICEKVLQANEKANGPNDSPDFDLVQNLAGLYAESGHFEKAVAMYKRAVEGFESARGPDDITTLETIDNLATVYHEQNRLEEAKAMHERALKGKEKSPRIGPKHTSTLKSAILLGNVYSKLNQPEKAELMYKRAVEGLEKNLGPEHYHTLLAVGNLAVLYQDQGRLQEAEVMHLREIEALEARPDSDRLTRYFVSLQNYGSLLAKLGQTDKAISYYERARDGFGPQNPRHKKLSDRIRSLKSPGASNGKGYLSVHGLWWIFAAFLGVLGAFALRWGNYWFGFEFN